MNQTELSRQQLVAELARLKLRDKLEHGMTSAETSRRRVKMTEEDNFIFIGDESYAQKR